MAKGYIVAHIRVSDAEEFEAFKSASGQAIKAHGGRVLARDPAPDRREGDMQGLCILIEFDSPEAARRFYESEGYTEARRLRDTCSETDLAIVSGL